MRRGSGGDDGAHLAEFFAAAFDEVLDLVAFEFLEGIDDPGFEVFGGFVGVAVCAAEGFGDDVIDDAVLEVVACGEAKLLGGGGGGIGVGVCFPEDGDAVFGADDGVPSVLHHSDAVADAEPERAAGAALADDAADDGHAEPGHLPEVDGDGFGDAAFFGADAGESATGVDEGDDGDVEFFGEFHFGEGFAVAFGVGAAEVGGDFFGGVTAFVVADDHALVRADATEAGDDGFVVAEAAVAVEFAELLGEHAEVVGGLGAAGMSGDLDGLVGGEFCVGGLEQGQVGVAEIEDFLGVVFGAIAGAGFEFTDLLFELEQGGFEGDVVGPIVAVVGVGHGMISANDALADRSATRGAIEYDSVRIVGLAWSRQVWWGRSAGIGRAARVRWNWLNT